MPSQSTERKKSWHSQTRLVCDRCCALVNSFLDRAIVTTCPEGQLAPRGTIPGLPYSFYLRKFLLILIIPRQTDKER